jgi:hypothetical protein
VIAVNVATRTYYPDPRVAYTLRAAACRSRGPQPNRLRLMAVSHAAGRRQPCRSRRQGRALEAADDWKQYVFLIASPRPPPDPDPRLGSPIRYR